MREAITDIRPVLIAGAGPVGLMLAYLLEQAGVPWRLFDKAAAPGQDLRASTFHPPTLDMLDAHGLAAPLIAQGRICPSWQIRIHETHEKAEFDLALIADATRHPFRLQCEQWKLCDLLLERLAVARSAGKLLFGAEALAVEQDAASLRLTVAADGLREVHEGTVLVGADGARSFVLEAAGLQLAGKTYPETTLLVTTRTPFEDHLPGLSNVNYVWTTHGTFSLLHLPDRWRCSLYPDPGETIEEAQQPASIQRKLQRIVPQGEPYEVLDQRAYRVHMRIVDAYRHGRIILAGDAAHINSPSGGMGMNGGLHDAFALSQAIVDVAGGAGLERFDRYGAARRPVAEREILGQADRNRSRMQERDPARRRELFGQLRRTAADPQAARAYLLRSSMIEGLRMAQAAA